MQPQSEQKKEVKNGPTAQAPTTALATTPPAAAATVDIAKTGEIVRVGFDTLQGFQALQRIAQAFAASSLVPDAYRGNVANCLIAIEMAARMGASPLMVMQNLYLVNGRPSWSSQFLIASFNNCGRFSAIRYRWSGEKGKSNRGCQAYSKELSTGEVVEGPEVTMGMAKSEGWIDKKGSKWVTLPELMLTYRSATFLIRTTAPELTMGLRTADEQEDIGDEPVHAPPPAPPKGVEGLKAIVQAKTSAAEPPKEERPPEAAHAAAESTPTHDPETGEVIEEPPEDSERIDVEGHA